MGFLKSQPMKKKEENKALTEAQTAMLSKKFELIDGKLYHGGKRCLTLEEAEQRIIQGLRDFYNKHRQD